MKKILSLFFALLLLLALSVPAWADNETSGSTTVTHVVSSGYQVSIPAAVTIPTANTQVVGVLANSKIPANKSLTFTITGSTNYDAVGEVAATGFKLKNTVGTNVFLKYTITYGTNGTVSKDTAFLTVSAGEAFASKNVTLTYALVDTPTQAGTYTDTLTFAVALVNT